jgi:transposase
VVTHTFSKEAEKFKQTSAYQKTDGNCFLEQEGAIIVEFMQQGTTITSEMYCTRNTENLRSAVHKKSRGMLTYGAVLLHDNVHQHRSMAARTRALLENLNWELLDRPHYSPDLTPSDYHLFTHLKNWFGSQRFSKNEEMMDGVKTRHNIFFSKVSSQISGGD